VDLFDSALTDHAALRALYPAAEDRVWRKDIGYLDEMARSLIAVCPMVVLATAGADGHCDASPRGGPPGFVTVLDDEHLAIPDATGNRRLDSLSNVVDSGRAGLLFVIPGRTTTLRVNGRACVSADPACLARLSPVGKPPTTAIVVQAQEVYAHCPKAFVRSRLWQPDSWPDGELIPTSAEVTLAHLRDPELTLADIRERERDSLQNRLA
jgi:PPOX class probable FMN-dependent enzyme